MFMTKIFKAMKNNRYFITALSAAFLAVVFSCSKENVGDTDIKENVSTEITISSTLSDVLPKVSFTPSYNGGKPESLSLVWSEGDALRVYNHSDRTQYDDFVLDPSYAGKKTGNFIGTPTHISSAVSFDVEVISDTDFDYSSQTQPSDGVTTNLKYLAKASNLSSYQAVEFTDFSSVLAITVKMPDSKTAAKIKSLYIKTDNAAIFGGKTELSITFDTIGDADSDGILHFFATLPMGSLSFETATDFLIHLNAPGDSHDVYTRLITIPASSSFTAGKMNTINVNAEKSALHAGATSCDGTTAAKAYLIGDKYQMQAMKGLMEDNAVRYFRMVDDVDLKDVNWEPLNYDTCLKELYFDGDGHVIDHLSSKAESYDYPSFAGVLKGTVCNVTFKNAAIKCDKKKGGVVAGFIGQKSSQKTGNCNNVIIDNAEVTAGSVLSGILGAQGDMVGTVSGCTVKNSSISTTAARVGGLIGSVVSGEEISDCAVESVSVAGASYYIGGLVGNMDGNMKVRRCHTSGTVKSTGGDYARSGGIIGVMLNGEVSDCYSTCTVDVVGQFGGGLIGDMQGGTLTKCHSTGTVKSTNHYSGGLIGVCKNKIVVDRCYFDGTISLPTSKAQAGGIISYLDSNAAPEISNCYTSGNWVGRRWFGGIIGGTAQEASSLKVTNCYTTASITGSPYGALVGSNNMLGSVTCSGLIAWWASGNMKANGNTDVPVGDNNYIGQKGTISAKAKEFGWDETIWNLDGDVPVLR